MAKNQKIVLISIIFIVVVIGIVLYLKEQVNSPLFRSSYENYAWGARSYGYVIYSNGTIKEYDDYDKEKELKKGKISREELEKLKNLANSVKNEYKKDSSGMRIFDAGVSTKEVYSERLGRWIVLSKWGDIIGSNSSEESQEILKLTEELYDKYLSE